MTDNFLREELMRKGALADLMLTSEVVLVEKVKDKGSLNSSDYDMVKFRTLRRWSKAKKQDQNPDLRLADSFQESP